MAPTGAGISITFDDPELCDARATQFSRRFRAEWPEVVLSKGRPSFGGCPEDRTGARAATGQAGGAAGSGAGARSTMKVTELSSTTCLSVQPRRAAISFDAARPVPEEPERLTPHS